MQSLFIPISISSTLNLTPILFSCFGRSSHVSTNLSVSQKRAPVLWRHRRIPLSWSNTNNTILWPRKQLLEWPRSSILGDKHYGMLLSMLMTVLTSWEVTFGLAILVFNMSSWFVRPRSPHDKNYTSLYLKKYYYHRQCNTIISSILINNMMYKTM